MRIVFAAAAAAFCLAGSMTFEADEGTIKARADLKQQQPRAIGDPTLESNSNSCRWANDMECDEPVIGTGACPAHTDYDDCRYLRYGESDACEFANDGECDEPNFGTGACVMGSDQSDCGDVSRLRFQNDACATAFNGVCEDANLGGAGACAARTDRSDCLGRERPMQISDHYFGRDDRVLVDTTAYPWAAVGEVIFREGQRCTATLIGPDILATAAHCVARVDGTDGRGEFETARGRADGPLRARIVAYFVSPRFNADRFGESRDIDGFDWALLRIDQRLGDQVGFVPVRAALNGLSPEALRAAELYQAGYSWDTGDHLSGNLGCHPLAMGTDNTFTHECDTTHGDSGSPFMVREGDQYFLVGVDSRFRSNPGGPFIYAAVSAGAFAPYVEEFAARRIGRVNRGGKSAN